MMFWIAILAIVVLTTWLLVRWNNRRISVEVYTPQDADRDLEKVTPYFTRKVVERKVKSLFQNQDHAKILQLLDNDVPSWWGLERMQLDILKLSDGDMDQLEHYIGVANSERDFIKVIELAESPESSRFNDQKDLFWGEHKRLIRRDLKQYLDWLKKK